MQVTQENQKKVFQLMTGTLSNDTIQRKSAEEQLKKMETIEGFSVVLLSLLTEKIENPIKLSCAIQLKNLVKRQWNSIINESLLKKGDRDIIKTKIISLMLQVEGPTRLQLSETVNLISTSDFYKEWPNLLEELVDKLKTSDLSIIEGVLNTCHSIFKKYRDQYETEEFVDHINYIIKGFGSIMKDLYVHLTGSIEKNQSNERGLKQIFICIEYLTEIFYTLNCVNLPGFFEENITDFMNIFDKILNYHNQLIDDVSESKPDVLIRVKTVICETLNIYMEKYLEEFEPFVDGFAKTIWNLLTKTSQAMNYDSLISKSLYFLTIVSKGPKHKMFGNENTLKLICEQIIIPNISLRKEDVEIFEDDETEYIRRDIEGSDSDTRRRSASELVQGLSSSFDESVTKILLSRVHALLSQYKENPKNFKLKDTAIYLIMALAIKTKTQKKGATSISKMININDIIESTILSDLKDNVNSILKADAIKFICTFRSYISMKEFEIIFPLLISSLQNQSRVVHTYSAWAIERLLFITEDNGQPRYNSSVIEKYASSLFQNLFGVLSMKGSSDNEYIMKAIMRITVILKSDMSKILKNYVQYLTTILERICKESKNPNFNILVFESFASVIKFNPQSYELFESILIEPLLFILKNNIEEFTPFVFQILSQIYQIRPTPIPEIYGTIFPNLLQPLLWENTGNIPGLVSLIGGYLSKSQAQIIKGGHLVTILGIFQKLISSKNMDHEGFHILNSIIENVPIEHFKQNFPTILGVLFQRLHQKKTPKFVKCLVIFFSLFIIKFGADALLQSMEQIQKGLFVMLAPIWIDYLPKVSGVYPRKLCSIATAKLLSESKILLVDYFQVDKVNIYYQFLFSLLKLLELPEEKTTEDSFDDEGLSSEYQVKYSKLSFASFQSEDPIKSYPDSPKKYLVLSLQKLLQTQDMRKKILDVFQSLPKEAQVKLEEYFKIENIKI